jgi:hypothetical protein
MKNNKWLFAATLSLAALTFSACNSDDDDTTPPPTGGDEEVITTVELHFSNVLNEMEYHFEWEDLDGPGGNAPEIDTINLPVGAYALKIEVYNKSNPANIIDVGEEITEEGTDHQFFFLAQGGAIPVFSFVYGDFDSNDFPIGLESVWTFTGATTEASQMRVVLRHELNKTAENVAIGDITNAGGSTDIDIIFPLTVQ